MLVLARKSGQSIMISDNIKIKVLDIRGKQVLIGIDAPIALLVHRDEIYKRIQLNIPLKRKYLYLPQPPKIHEFV